MTKYLILGGGKFGRLALERLSRQDADASFLIVDRDPTPLPAAVVRPAVQQVQAEAITFLVQHLGGAARFDWIVPMVPLHVTYHWLMQGPAVGADWRPAAVPEAVGRLVPAARRGPAGELYLSRAQHLCPDDCAEPAVCPVTFEARDPSLYQQLAALNLPGYQVRVIASRQLAPGVGGYPPRSLFDLARDLDDVMGKVLIATACRCHGVVHGLVRLSGGKSV